jgi:hypothetical protein
LTGRERSRRRTTSFASSIVFIVFTFSPLLVAIQVVSGQLSPRIISTTLLRDKALRRSVALFVYAPLLAVAVKSRVDTIPHFLVSLLGILGLVSVVVFMFLIDYAARLLRPVSIVWQIAQQGLKVIDDVYPRPLPLSPVPAHALGKLGRPERTISHRGTSAIVIAVNLEALVAAAKRTDTIIELAPRVGNFGARDDPLFLLRGGGASKIDDSMLCGQVAFGPERTIEQDSTFAFPVIVDIAIKALLPAINDPTTAVLTIDQLQRLLRTVADRDLRDGANSFQVVRRPRATIEYSCKPCRSLASLRCAKNRPARSHLGSILCIFRRLSACPHSGLAGVVRGVESVNWRTLVSTGSSKHGGAGHRRLDNVIKSGAQSGEGNHPLCGIPESGVEQAADAFTSARRSLAPSYRPAE